MSILKLILSAIRQLTRLCIDQHAETSATVQADRVEYMKQFAILNQKFDVLQAQILAGNESIAHMFEVLQSDFEQILNQLLLETAASFKFAITVDGHTTYGATMLTLTDSQKATLTVDPASVVDAKGAPASLDGGLAFASSDETIATVVASDDGLSATLTAVRPGSCTVTGTADADLGEGVKPVTGILEVTVTPGQAVKFEITAGAPEEQ